MTAAGHDRPRERGEIRAGSIDCFPNYMSWPAAGNLGADRSRYREG